MKRDSFVVALVFLIFFVIALITSILAPLIPDIITSFKLSLTLVALLPFSFFIAYGIMSIPAGMLVERFHEKPICIIAFILAFFGSLSFALFPGYSVAIFSLFLIGAGMAMLQVAINPLLRVAGGEENFAFNSAMTTVISGLASFGTPLIYSYLVQNLKQNPDTGNFLIRLLAQIVPANLPWVSLYWIFCICALLMLILLSVYKFPAVERKEDERAGTWSIHIQLFKNRVVILYFIGIFCYVGTEQGVANWMSKFLNLYHNYDPQTSGAWAVSWFWSLITAGCLLGLFLLKLIDSRKVLIGFCCAALVCLTVALFSSGPVAVIAFPLMGFCISVMWSITFSLALNSLDRHHGSFSGILCAAIAGGAVIPLVIGRIGDIFGLRFGMMFLYITLGYILSVGFWAKPLIQNKTFRN